MISNYESIINELNKKVSYMSKSNNGSFIQKSKSINFKSPLLIYFIPPVSILIILILYKPSFIMKKTIIHGDNIENKINILKMLFITVLLSGIIDFIIYKNFFSI